MIVRNTSMKLASASETPYHAVVATITVFAVGTHTMNWPPYPAAK
jgi:hypothetical protein